jgi:DNA polymerase-3 subunit alpha
MSEFVHLHLHTEYSLLDGACRVEELLDQAQQMGMPALAVTEHGNMFSAVVFHDAARKRGVKPILGCEVYVAPGDRRTKSGTPGETANHLVLLAETNEGFHNLIKLVSSGYTEGFYYKPRIDKALLAQHAKGLIGLSSCLKGEVAEGLYKDRLARSREAAATYRDILGPDNFFLELQYQGLEEQLVVNRGLPGIARDLGLPMVCTNDVHYLRQDDYKPHDILLCIGTGKVVNDTERLKYHGDQFFLKTAAEMAEIFKEFPDAVANTVRIGERCDVNLNSNENHLPNFDVPPGYTVDSYFEHVVREGFTGRLPRLRELGARSALKYTIDEYERRLSYEIDMIKQMRYSGYFLIVWDFIRYAREQRIPVGPGRGSAAGSVVAWCLRITDVDPIEFDLIFERFLNPERVSLPDIDIDFCERRRGEVIDYVTRKYGRENVAQIITFGTMKAKAVVRDVGRVLDMTYADVDKVAKLIPPALDMTLDKALEENPALKELRNRDPKVKELIDIGRRLEGMTRHASVHAAGVVIAPRPITEFAPLYKGKQDEITTQWAMKEIERVGLLKMDFLGLSTLTLLDDALAEIKRTEGVTLVLETLPLNVEDASDDETRANVKKAYQLFCDGRTAGVFQFESSGMRETLRKARPQRFDDLIALNALYRPGPLRAGVVDDYIARKHGRVEIKYETKELEPILKDTYGVIAYQEQVMRVARDLAGFTMGEADLLRKAMGKKDPKVMAKMRERFEKGGVERGLQAKKATKIFDLMEYFAGYGFNKSHSTTYALLAYQTAYLKANYPPHFMAALLTIESQNTEKLAFYLGECRDLGVTVLAPDVNVSGLPFTVAPGGGVQFGLGAVRNVGEGAIHSLLASRTTRGRIDSLDTLCEDVDLRLVNKRVVESLVKAGALDSLHANDAAWTAQPVAARRARLTAAIDGALEQGGRRQADRALGQSLLFGGDAADEAEPAVVLPLAAAWTEEVLLKGEKEALGLYLSGYPLARFEHVLQTAGARTSTKLGEVQGEGSMGGLVSGCRFVKTRRGDRMAVFMLEDQEGSVEVVVYPEPFKEFASLIENDRMLLVTGKVEVDDDRPKIRATAIIDVKTAAERQVKEVCVNLRLPQHGLPVFRALHEVLTHHRGDKRVQFEVRVRRGGAASALLVRADPQVRVRPSEDLVTAVEQICGLGSVVLR